MVVIKLPSGTNTSLRKIKMKSVAIFCSFYVNHAKCNVLVLVWFILSLYQHDDGYKDGRAQIKVHTDERTQAHSARSSLTVTHLSTYWGWRSLTSDRHCKVQCTQLVLWLHVSQQWILDLFVNLGYKTEVISRHWDFETEVRHSRYETEVRREAGM